MRFELRTQTEISTELLIELWGDNNSDKSERLAHLETYRYVCVLVAGTASAPFPVHSSYRC